MTRRYWVVYPDFYKFQAKARVEIKMHTRSVHACTNDYASIALTIQDMIIG